MTDIRNIVSVDCQGSYHKTIQVEHHNAFGTGFVRIETQCPGQNIGNAQFNMSVEGAKELRDALFSLFPTFRKFVADEKVDAAPKGPQEYKGNGKHEWEDVGGCGTRRLRVPGGWLYRSGLAGTSTFVPMPEVVGYKI